jgi:hypothetical protein
MKNLFGQNPTLKVNWTMGESKDKLIKQNKHYNPTNQPDTSVLSND